MAISSTISDAELEARGTLLNAFIPALEELGLEPEDRTVTQDGFLVVVRGRVIHVRFSDIGHYLAVPTATIQELAIA